MSRSNGSTAVYNRGMAAIKLHVFRTEMGDDGTHTCDYRGGGEHGAGENDQHRTILEKDPASEDEIAEVIELGPNLNAIFARLVASELGAAGNVASAFGLEGHGPIGLRIGVWDH